MEINDRVRMFRVVNEVMYDFGSYRKKMHISVKRTISKPVHAKRRYNWITTLPIFLSRTYFEIIKKRFFFLNSYQHNVTQQYIPTTPPSRTVRYVQHSYFESNLT